MKKSILFLMVVVLCMSLWACGQEKSIDVWSDAIYTEDTELGKGEKTNFMKKKLVSKEELKKYFFGV